MTIVVPNSPDGFATNPWGQYARIVETGLIRITGDGGYRITADAPSDFNGVSNTDTYQAPPDNYLICQRSGEKVPVSEGLVQEWTGLWVRRKYLDPRHPQELVRSVPEKQTGSPSPPQDDRFIGSDVYANGVSVSDLDP